MKSNDKITLKFKLFALEFINWFHSIFGIIVMNRVFESTLLDKKKSIK